MLAAKEDSLVCVDAQIQACKHLRDAKLVIYDEARHGIWYDRDDVQKDLWDEIDRFTQKTTRDHMIKQALILSLNQHNKLA